MPTQNTENNYIENWVKSNETRLTEIRNGNPELYGAVNGVLNYIANYLGSTKPIQEIVSANPDPKFKIGDRVKIPKTKTAQKQKTPELDPNNFKWEQSWGSGLTPEMLVTNYKKYVKLKGKTASKDAELLVESFGELSVINDNYSNLKNYDEAYNYYLSKNPKIKDRWNIYRFKLKPEYESIFKNFKKITDLDNMGNALIYKVENITKFYQFLESILRADLLYNSLTIPDLILGKKTNSITVTEQEQSEFDDLLDELDNLEL